ncbi:hypothetical protein [Burkholderia pseudomallei]|uniref:Transmembrane protein n=1 Tax=Burkholderia pseudomallei TaxID=28450 RepID=A0A0C5B4H1_BURPE|nr:hypothetical protein [Burkholderia pseudomallei]AJL34936.1 hypothetical protein pBPS053 [Burkholderia pseudomallei]
MMSALDSMPRVGRGTVLGASVALYAISLLMPAMYFEKEPSLTGMSVLSQGWLGLLMLNPSWLANPLYTIAAVQFTRSRYSRASIFSGAAVACALCSLFTTKWYFNEANATPIASFGIGFYTWLVAQIVLLFGSLRLRQDAAGARTS